LKILSFSRVIPYDGIPHAGGEYTRRHYQALTDLGHEVIVVVPGTARNYDALEKIDAKEQFHVVDFPKESSLILRAIDRARQAYYSIYPELPYLRALSDDEAVSRLLNWADVVEFQWTESAAIGLALNLGSRELPTICVAHDILTQKYTRKLEHTRPLSGSRIKWRTKLSLVRRREIAILKSVDCVITFSSKDSSLVSKLDDSLRPLTVSPPLEVPAMQTYRQPPMSGIILFVGALNRPENEEAAIWFLRQVWRSVLAEIPHAKFVIAGSSPTSALLKEADLYDSVVITGYVDDLIPFYQDAEIVVVPLFSGAGVKFKTVTAMLWGVPVAATPTGVEGIADGRSDIFLCVTEKADEFAHAVIGALSAPAAAHHIAATAREFALTTSSELTFKKAITGVFEHVAGLR
jgi:glycosyltransferase involved in cell wall biosynthesis